MITPVGYLSFAAGADISTGNRKTPLCPLVYGAMGQAAIAIAAAIDGIIELQAQIAITPPTLAITLAGLATFEAQCTAAIGFGVPSVSFDASASAQLVADLTTSLTLLVQLEALLTLPIVAAYLGYPYPAPGTGLGAAVSVIPGSISNALILAAVDIPLLTSGIARHSLETFADGVTYPSAGVFTNLGQVSTSTLNAIAQARASIEYQLDLAVKLNAFVKVNPPTFTASIDAMAKFAASLKVIPRVDFQVHALARVLASLQAEFGILYQLGIALSRPDGALFVYTYDGVGPFGVQLTAELATTWLDGTTSTSLPCEAAVFATYDSASWTALVGGGSLAFFGGAA